MNREIAFNRAKGTSKNEYASVYVLRDGFTHLVSLLDGSEIQVENFETIAEFVDGELIWEKE